MTDSTVFSVCVYVCVRVRVPSDSANDTSVSRRLSFPFLLDFQYETRSFAHISPNIAKQLFRQFF